MIRGSFLIALCISCLIAAAAARAENYASNAAVPFDITTAQDVAQQSAAVRAGMQPGGIYSSLNARSRYLVTRDLDIMTALVGTRGDLSNLSDAQRVRLFDAQEQANSLLTGNPIGWWKCEQTEQTGSHLMRTLCWSRDDS